MGTEVSSFWSGALAIAAGRCLVDVAARVGGWERVPHALATGDLRCGLSPTQRHRWLNAKPYVTRGLAVRLSDAIYPSRLGSTPRPAAVLHVEGHISCVEQPVVAIVGSRSASLRSRSQARFLAWAFASSGYTVASGLALGVDAAAHRGALTAGQTVAVLGHGLSCMYPSVHASLRAEIVRSGGAILTSFPDTVQPAKWTFPIRNRWIAGLADLVIVVEAGERSGALWTARHAASMHREVVVVAQDGRLSAGCKFLADRGAGVVDDLWPWCLDKGLGLPGAPPPWLRDVLTGHSLQVVSCRYRLAPQDIYASLGELSARGQVEALSHGRYGPKGPLMHIASTVPTPTIEGIHG